MVAGSSPAGPTTFLTCQNQLGLQAAKPVAVAQAQKPAVAARHIRRNRQTKPDASALVLVSRAVEPREGFDRGWYAGACGYLGLNESEFSVAIRSARFQPDRVTLFAGAGIVAASNADEEWQELNNKLTTVFGILNGL